jgi:FAD:protein FMN transferase
VDSLLIALNEELSTYIEESTISSFNQSGRGIELRDGEADYFMDNLRISGELYRLTDGLFDPTVMPLVNYWGFGFAGREAPTAIDSMAIDSLLNLVGWEKIQLDTEGGDFFIGKKDSAVMLDFSAVAKGYAVDVLCEFFNSVGLDNYLIDIGGELCAEGPGRHGEGWVIGVNTPDPTSEENAISERFILKKGGVATSGNYRNFREIEGKIIGHTLNPRTGFPEMNNLLSVTIWHSETAFADALATATMVAGYPDAYTMVEGLSEAEGYFIFVNEEGELERSWTEGFEAFFLN